MPSVIGKSIPEPIAVPVVVAAPEPVVAQEAVQVVELEPVNVAEQTAEPTADTQEVAQPYQQELQVTPDMLVIALADYPATEPGQLALVEGQTYIRITVDHGNGWSYGCTLDGTMNGVFPQTFVDFAPQ
jgi:SH3 domain